MSKGIRCVKHLSGMGTLMQADKYLSHPLLIHQIYPMGALSCLSLGGKRFFLTDDQLFADIAIFAVVYSHTVHGKKGLLSEEL